MGWRKGERGQSESAFFPPENRIDRKHPKPRKCIPMSTGKISPISLLSALALVLTSTQAFAGASNKSGNPFGNGTFFGNDGTFSAVLRGKNMTGVTQFSTYSSGKITTGFNSITNAATADTAANIPGSVSVYLNGVSYVGIASGVLDPSAQTISAVFSSFSVRSATNFGVNQNLTNNTLANTSTNSGAAGSTNATSTLSSSLLTTNLSTNANITNYLVNTPTNITNTVSISNNTTNITTTNLFNQFYAFTNIGSNIAGTTITTNAVITNITATNTNLITTFTTTTNWTPFYTNTFIGVSSNNTNNSSVTNSITATNSAQTNNLNSLVISTNGSSISYTAGFSQSILGGAFTANFQNKYPNQTFYGDGSVTTPQAVVNGTNTSIVADTVTFNVNGVRVSSSSSTYY